MSDGITGPVDKVTNVNVDLSPRMIMAGDFVTGSPLLRKVGRVTLSDEVI